MSKTQELEVSKKLDELEKRITELENTKTYPPVPYPNNNRIGPSDMICSKCGLSFTDKLGRPMVMGYFCNRTDCPCFPVLTC